MVTLILNPSLDSIGGKPVITEKTIAKLFQITENLHLCDIWIIHNPKRKRFTYRWHHSTGFIQRRLDYYFFVSNSLREFVKFTDALAAFSRDHSAITLSLCYLKNFQRCRGLWKLNESLIKRENYLEQMKTPIKNALDNFRPNNKEYPGISLGIP